MTLQQWSKERMGIWQHTEWYHSAYGEVSRADSNVEWVAKVNVGGRLYRINETYVSAASAMSAVERTWKREKERGKKE